MVRKVERLIQKYDTTDTKLDALYRKSWVAQLVGLAIYCHLSIITMQNGMIVFTINYLAVCETVYLLSHFHNNVHITGQSIYGAMKVIVSLWQNINWECHHIAGYC